MPLSLRRAIALVAAIAAGSASLLVGASSAVASSPAAAAATTSASAEGDAMVRLGGCLAGGGTGDVILLIDESESIRDTDPDNARVTSAKYFVQQLAGYASSSGASINVQVATFSQNFTPLTGWLPLDSAQAPAVLSAVDGVAQRNEGWETDYWSALNGARQALTTSTSGRSTSSCSAVVWFSDGELWFNPVPKGDARKGFAPDLVIEGQDAADRARDLAQTDLCRDGGLADQLRTSGVLTFGIGLDGPASPPGGFDLMQSIATGFSPSGQKCGAVVDPVPGAFFRASDIDGLLLAFDQWGTPGQPPIVQDKGVCQAAVCLEQAHRVVLDASTPQATFLASSDVAAAVVSIQTPAGTVVQVPRGAGVIDADGASLTYSWPSDRTVSIRLDSAGSGSWKGLWQLAFTDPTGQSPNGASRSHLRVQGALVPVWRGADAVELHTDDVVTGQQIGLAMRDGTPGDASLVQGSVSFTAVLRDSAGTERTILDTTDPARLAAPTDIDLSDVAVGPATMTLSSRITTAATEFGGAPVEGTALEPETVTIPLTVAAPLSYPTVASSVDFGAVEAQKVEVTASLPVSGDGCVVLGDVSVAAGPADLGRVEVRAADDGCIPASGGAIPVVLTTERSGNGTLNGSVAIELRPSADGKAIPSTVTFSASLSRPIDPVNFLVVLIVALVLGPGLPLGVLFLLKWWTSVIPSRLLYGFVVPVEVDDTGVRRDGRSFTIVEKDLAQQVRVPRPARRLEIGDVVVRARTGASPFGRGFATVEAAGRTAISNVGVGTDRSLRKARLPLNIHNHWVLLRTPGAPRGQAQILVLLGSPDRDTRERLEQSIVESAPRRLARLIEIETSQGHAPADEESGSPFGGAGAAEVPTWSSLGADTAPGTGGWSSTGAAPSGAAPSGAAPSPWGTAGAAAPNSPATAPDPAPNTPPSGDPNTPPSGDPNTPPSGDPNTPPSDTPWRPW